MAIFDWLFGKKKEVVTEDLDSLNLADYTGTRYELSDGKGNIIYREDTRDIRYEKLKKIDDLRNACRDVLLDKAPVYEQLNALAGRLSTEETNTLNKFISDNRNKFQNKKQLVLNETDIDNIEKINWD